MHDARKNAFWIVVIAGVVITLALNYRRAPTVYPDRTEFDEDAEEFISDLVREMYDKSGDRTPKGDVVYHVSWAITEINNGGFHQFFYNSTGGDAFETAAMLRRIGAPDSATLVETGCALFPNGTPSKDYQERRAQLERFTAKDLVALRDLEERFYSRKEDLNMLLKRFWEREP